MAKEKEEKKVKPTIEADIVCPHCEGQINVRHFRKRVNASVKAIYKVMTEVKTPEQLRLALDDGASTGPTVATGKKKKTA